MARIKEIYAGRPVCGSVRAQGGRGAGYACPWVRMSPGVGRWPAPPPLLRAQKHAHPALQRGGSSRCETGRFASRARRRSGSPAVACRPLRRSEGGGTGSTGAGGHSPRRPAGRGGAHPRAARQAIRWGKRFGLQPTSRSRRVSPPRSSKPDATALQRRRAGARTRLRASGPHVQTDAGHGGGRADHAGRGPAVPGADRHAAQQRADGVGGVERGVV